MSLLDALIRDPAQPIGSSRTNIWIAIRTDDNSGSGTMSDPWNGSPRLDSPLTITNVSFSGTTVTATSTGHPYNVGDVVVVSDFTESAYNGTFQIVSKAINTFTYIANSVPLTSGALVGSARKILELRFDSILKDNTKIGTNICINLGPGLYVTQGYYETSVDTPAAGSWQVQSGMQIVGSGIDTTKLLLINAGNTATQFYAIGHALVAAGSTNVVNDVEIRDLTIDANMASVGTSSSGAAGCGIRLMGSHCRVYRVRVINVGSRGSPAPPVAFGIAVIVGNTNSVSGNSTSALMNSGIEQCQAWGGINQLLSVGWTRLFHVGAKVSPGTDPSFTTDVGYGIGCYIRNCFVDLQQTDGTSYAPNYIGVSMNRTKGGVIEGNQVHNIKYGGPFQDVNDAYEIVIRNNSYRNIAVGIYWNIAVPNKGIRKLSILGNSFELSPLNNLTTIMGTSSSSAVWAIAIEDGGTGGIYGRIILRKNRLYYLNRSDLGQGQGIRVYGAGALVCREDIIELNTNSTKLSFNRITSALCFNNKLPNGVLQQGVNMVDGSSLPEIPASGEDSLILKMLFAN